MAREQDNRVGRRHFLCTQVYRIARRGMGDGNLFRLSLVECYQRSATRIAQQDDLFKTLLTKEADSGADILDRVLHDENLIPANVARVQSQHGQTALVKRLYEVMVHHVA